VIHKSGPLGVDGVRLADCLDFAPYVIAGVAVACAVWIVATTLWGVIVTYTALPVWDGWSEVTTKQHLAMLFDQHNEHRIFVSRLFMLVDGIWFDANYKFCLGATLATQALTVALLVYLFCRARPVTRVEGAGATAFAVSMFFWFEQSENLTWGFNTQFVIVAACATAAFAVFAFNRGVYGLAFALLSAAVAAFAMANGVLVPLLLISLAVWTRRPWWQIAVLVVGSAAILTAFFTGYRFGVHEPEQAPLPTLVADGANYALAYLGGPFAQGARNVIERLSQGAWGPAGRIAIWFGSIGFALFLGAGVCLIGRGKQAQPAQLVLFHIASLIVITAVMTAKGRMQFGLEQALSSRYGTLALLFWTAIVLLLWSFQRSQTSAARSAVLAGLSVIGLFIAFTQMPIIVTVRKSAETNQEAAAALLAKVDVASVLLRSCPDVEALKGQAQILRTEHHSIFAKPWSDWLDSPVSTRARVVPGKRCKGFLDEIAPVDAGGAAAWRVRGWAWDKGAKSVPEAILVVGGDGTIVGYGLPGYERPDVSRTISSITSGWTGWQGFFSHADPRSVRAYALLKGGHAACPLDLSMKAVISNAEARDEQQGAAEATSR
jgi:hypothetical protein